MQERPTLPRCPDELLSSDLSGVCLRVWLAVRKVQGQNAVAYARLDTYARMTGKNRAQVSRALKDLEEAGWIERTREGLACKLPAPSLEAPAVVAPEGNEPATEVAEMATLDNAGTVAESATLVVKTATEVAESATPSESGSESSSESLAGWLLGAPARGASVGDGQPHPAATHSPVLYVPDPDPPPADDPADVIEQATGERPVLIYANTLRKVIVGPDLDRRALFAAFVAEWVSRYGPRRCRATHLGEAFRADYGTAIEPRHAQRTRPDPESAAQGAARNHARRAADASRNGSDDPAGDHGRRRAIALAAVRH